MLLVLLELLEAQQPLLITVAVTKFLLSLYH